MKSPFLLCAGWLALGLLCLEAHAITVTVPGTANPWLAGAADGTTGQLGQDVAPAQSPVAVTVQAGDTLSFFTTGSIEPPSTGITPEGDTSEVRSQTALNGIGGITGAPLYSLIGVFLDASEPTSGGEPSELDFSGTNRNYATLAPALRQPFFIGNGMDKTGTRQQITVPTGATRLLLGTLFVHSWYYRTGSITVTVDTAPTASNGTAWGTPFEITGPSDVSTDGTLIGAYNISDYTGSSIPGVTLNGVLFTGLVTQYFGASVGPFTLYGDTTRGYNFFGDSVAPYTDLDGDYRDILKSGLYDNSVSADGYTLTIDDLEIGKKYTIQFWVNESNGGTNPVASPENATIITDVSGVTLDRNTLNQVGGVGQTVIGTFTANTTNKTFRITSSHGGRVVLNAFQLRKLPPNPADVVWQTPTTVASPADVVTTGTLVGAYDVGGSPVTVFINGVRFSPFAVSSGTVDSFTLTPTGSTFNSGYGSINAPYAALDPNYSALLGSAIGVHNPGKSFTLTMDSLTVGEEYTVQFWVSESAGVVNPINPTPEFSTVITAGNSVTLDRNTTNEGGGVGQYVVGTFTADSSSKSFAFTATDGGFPVLNGFQLRKASADPAAVTWQTPSTISGPSDVMTTGDLVAAYNVQGSAQAATVNGVLFDPLVVNETGGTAGNFTITSDFSLTNQSSNYGWTTAPFVDLNADYRTLLQSAYTVYPGASYNRWFTLTMGSLTVGEDYIVQFWVNESQNLIHAIDQSLEKPTIISSGTRVVLDRNTTNALGGVGQFVVGTFTATSATQTFAFSAADGAAPTLNAFQLRKINDAPQFVQTELPFPDESFTVTGGTGPYTFDITAGALPAGLGLTSAGMITGTFAGSSVGGVAIRVTDSLGATGGRLFQYSYDLGLPEIALKRVVIQDVGGTNRMAIFEVTASDDVALAPFETDPLFTNASHAFEYRRKEGTGAFSAWETAMYYPYSYPPALPFDTANDLRVEFRSIDASGCRSRTLAYDIKKGALATTDQSFGVSVGSSTTLIPNAGTSIIKLFTEELSPGSASVKVTAVDASGKISAVYNSNRVTPANSPKTSLTLGTAITDAASGLLLPPTTGKNDGITDFVVCTEGGLKIIVNKSAVAPSLAVHSLVLPVENGAAQKVAVGDVNADGADDIIALVYKTTGPELGYFLVTYLNQATATSTNGTFTTSGFAAPTSILIPLVFAPRSLTAGDLNGDRAAEVVFGYRGPISEIVGVYVGTPGGALIPPTVPLFVSNDEDIVDLKIANYSGHITGHKDIIVGIVGGPDAMYPTATHMAKHRVLVAQLNGTFKAAPIRRLAALSLSTADKDVFNIAVGNLSDRVVPDIVSCQFDSTSPAGTIDSGFLPPANAAGELNWMQNNDNGVQTFGISGGKPRRVALADLTGNNLPDVILANSDSGNIELQANTKPLLTAFPAKVVPSPTLSVPTLTNVTPGGAAAFALRGIASQPWKFSYAIGKPPADIVARIEYQLNNGPWTTLPGGFLARSGTTFSTTVSSVPDGLLRFRCWATSASQTTAGVYDSYSLPSSYIRSIDAQQLACTAEVFPDEDEQFNRFAHDSEFVTYYVNYRNDGFAPANNVVVAAAIPPFTTFTNRPAGISHSSDFVLDNADPAKATVVSWNIPTLAPGASTNRFFTVQVKSTALASLKNQPILLKGLTDAYKKAPSATADLFKKYLVTNKAYGIYSAPPGPSFKAQVASGADCRLDVLPPLTLTQTLDAAQVGPGQLVNVTLKVKNHGALTINNISVTDVLEKHFSLEGVRPRTPPEAIIGNFIGTLDPDPDTTTNPKYEVGAAGRVLTWNVGALTPGNECTMEYQLRVRYDVDAKTFRNGVEEENQVEFTSFNALGVQSNGKAATAQTKLYPTLLTGVDAALPSAIPSLNFTMDCVPLVGSATANANTWSEPTNRQEMNVGGEDMAVVSEGGLIRVKLRYSNSRPVIAKRCTLTYQVPDGAEMLGYFRRNSIDDSLSSGYTFFGPSGIIPATSPSSEFKKVRSMIIQLGDLAGNSDGVIDFILAAYSPPIPKAINEKISPAGTVIRSKALVIESDSLVQATPGTPWQVPVFVARPVSFDIESRPDQGHVVKAIGSSQDVRYLITFRNNGWTAASNVKVQASVPAGTTYISSSLLNSDLTSQFTSGILRNAANASVTADKATKVEFDIGTLPSGFQNNAAAYGYAELIVRIPATLPTTFPKDGRLKHRSEITGTDSVTNKRAQGSYSLFAAPSGIASTDKVKNLSSASLAEVKVLQTNARLFAGKQTPSIVRPGQAFPIIVFFGNTGDTAITNAKVALQVPWGTDFVSAGTTPGFVKFTDKDAISGQSTPNVYRWTFPTLDGHSAKAVTMMVRVKNNAAYEGNYLYENSAVVTGTAGTTTVERVPGNARLLVLSTNPVASAWQWFGAQLQAVGGNLFGQRPPALQTAVNGITANTSFYTVAGADILTLPNNVLIIPLLGGNVVAAGGGNLIANDGSSLIANDGASVIAAGAGNLINVTGPGLLSTANLNAAIASIVASGGGNIVASGGGNLIANDGASLIANDGASLGPISINLAGIVASGGGNVVASGGGNILASGGGNVVASGGGNVTENLTSSRPGSTLLANDGASFIQVNSLIANDGSSLIANDGASLIANDGASLIANDGASILSDQGGGLITK